MRYRKAVDHARSESYHKLLLLKDQHIASYSSVTANDLETSEVLCVAIFCLRVVDMLISMTKVVNYSHFAIAMNYIQSNI